LTTEESTNMFAAVGSRRRAWPQGGPLPTTAHNSYNCVRMSKKKSRSLQTPDRHEKRGQHHFIGSPLAEDRVDRVYESWGKLSTDSPRVSVQADATVALPILASALAATGAGLVGRRKAPTFDPSSRLMTIDGLAGPLRPLRGRE
jgi:hypothetical protein